MCPPVFTESVFSFTRRSSVLLSFRLWNICTLPYLQQSHNKKQFSSRNTPPPPPTTVVFRLNDNIKIILALHGQIKTSSVFATWHKDCFQLATLEHFSWVGWQMGKIPSPALRLHADCLLAAAGLGAAVHSLCNVRRKVRVWSLAR